MAFLVMFVLGIINMLNYTVSILLVLLLTRLEWLRKYTSCSGITAMINVMISK